MKDNKLYSREAVIREAADILYVIGDVRESQYDAHTLHQTFDLCAPGNIDRAHRTLDLAAAEIETLLVLSTAPRPGSRGAVQGTAWSCDSKRHRLLSGLVHEYLVARVVADWLEIAFPPQTSLVAATSTHSYSASGTVVTTGRATASRGSQRTGTDSVVTLWKERASEAWLRLQQSTRTSPSAFSRKIPPL